MRKSNKIGLFRTGLLIIVGLMIATLLTSCDAGFNAVNTDRSQLTTVKPVFLLNDAIVSSSDELDDLLCETTIVRQGIGPFTGVLACANINQDNKDTEVAVWNRYYGTVLKDIANILNNTKSNSNIYNMARIWRAYSFMVLTDTYGDVPYSQAAKGLSEAVVFPKYDSQKSIYIGNNGILEQLASASAALDPSQSKIQSDALYNGNIIRWKRLGYSLLLRGAMRLVKVKPDTAKKYVKIAVDGGVMQSNEDNAVIMHTPDYTNPAGNNLNGSESTNYYLDSVFVTYLQKNHDPRLASIAVRYVGAKTANDQTPDRADRNPEDQIGMPQGYDSNTLPAHVKALNIPGLNSLYAYSQIDRTRMVSQQAPQFPVTYSETELLLAEAVVRGYITGDAASLFSNGVEANLHQYAAYGKDVAISQSDIDKYLSAHKLKPNNKLEQINTQYWVASFLNGPETWANFRRSGFPDIPPNPLSGDLKNENFMRRLTYPNSEYSVNMDAVQEAEKHQGPDRIDTRVWWDVKK
jgi:hypothetical protein